MTTPAMQTTTPAMSIALAGSLKRKTDSSVDTMMPAAPQVA